MYFSVGRNFGMLALIEAIPVAPGSSRKVEQQTTGASSGVFGASSGVLVRRLGTGIIIVNKSKHQVKQEEQVDKARSKVSFSLSSTTLQHASGAGLQQRKVQG